MSRLAWLIPSIGSLLFCAHTANARHPGHDPQSAVTQENISDRAPDRASPVTGVTSWKAALHMHGALSEGDATIRSHHKIAQLLGIDVIWWTEHDHMIVAEAHRATRFGFDALTEAINVGEPWVASSNADLVLQKSASFFRSAFSEQSAEITTAKAAVGTGSLKMSGRRAINNRQSFMYVFNAEGTRRRYSLAADITVRLKVFPETTGPEATGVVTFILSRPFTPAITSTQRLEIQYYLSNSGASPVREDNVYRVPVPFVPGQWNELVFPVTQDAIAGYPFINGKDNSLTEVLFGLESKNNALATCYYDDLRIDLASTGVPLFEWHRAELANYNALNQGVKHLEGLEHSSILPHMLEYGPNVPLSDWVAYQSLSPGFVNGWLVDWQAHHRFIGYRVSELAHQRGAATSYAHVFGTGTPLLATTPTKEQVLSTIRAINAYNTDILEVGYRQRERPMPDHLWVWDQLALNRIYLTGIGVSDSHGADIAETLSDPTFSMVQFIYADTNQEVQLADALRAGRTYFADPIIYDGEMDIQADSGALMGNILVTDRPSVSATVTITGLTPGDQVRLIDSANLASTNPVNTSWISLPATVSVNQTTGSFLRAEVHSQVTGRTEKAFSNPIYFMSSVPTAGIDWRRAAIDVVGVTSQKFDHFRLDNLSWSLINNAPGIVITGHNDGQPGAIDLDFPPTQNPIHAELSPGLTGKVLVHADRVFLTDLVGSGSITLRADDPPVSAPCGDVNNSGVVDIDDLNIVLASWNLNVLASTSGDINADARVNVDDLNIVLASWGNTCN